ncbi:MAG: DNA polymerase III subunit delta [Mobiluncus sp.]|uniref:DNA polymerase III subunit delta n=1 Tax=Mobiluncus sp. TaxID=47293 RepID=UPI00258EDED8|nr:DNA polymerase III subunit delta [Mobiluncus sp.]MCI6584900.1 DNA polymerase III subunit delta [Mobiluncus sp.]
MATKKKTYKGKTPAAGSGYPSWSRARLAPVVLLLGRQEVFVRRALDSLKAQALASGAGDFGPPEVTEISAGEYVAGALAQYLSPSLFGGAPLVIARGLEDANAGLLDDLVTYVAGLRDGAEPQAHLILTHAGGVRGKKVLDLVKQLAAGGSAQGGRSAGDSAKAGSASSAKASGKDSSASKQPLAGIYSCDDLKKREDKEKFLASEAARLKRPIDPAAATALVDALGEELTELVSVADQLLETAGDLDKPLDEGAVKAYLRGRVETTGFDIADAAVTGNVGDALAKLRHARAVGVEPVAIVAAVGMKLRQLLQLAAPPPAPLVVGEGILAEVKPMPSWMANKIRPALRYWDDARLGAALQAVSKADEQVKGASRDPDYALEAMVLEICRRASAGRRQNAR